MWSHMVTDSHTWTQVAVVTPGASSLCPQPGQEELPAPSSGLGAALGLPRLSEEFVSSQDWQSIKGKLRVLLSNPGLIYVHLKDAN